MPPHSVSSRVNPHPSAALSPVTHHRTRATSNGHIFPGESSARFPHVLRETIHSHSRSHRPKSHYRRLLRLPSAVSRPVSPSHHTFNPPHRTLSSDAARGAETARTGSSNDAAGTRSTSSAAVAGRRSTAVAQRRLSAVAADGPAADVAGTGAGEEGGSVNESEGLGAGTGTATAGGPLRAVQSTPATPALATAAATGAAPAAGVVTSRGAEGLEWEEWRDAVASAVLLTACAVGLLTGASVSLFNEGVHAIRDAVWQGVPPEEGSTWLRSQSAAATWHLHIFVPLAGGVVVGILNAVRSEIKDLPFNQTPRGGSSSNNRSSSRRSSSPAAHGYDSSSDSSSSDSGRSSGGFSLSSRAGQSIAQNLVAAVRPVLKAVAAAVTLGTGNSLGPEGPSVEIGSSIGKGASRAVQGGRERTIALVAAGSAAGISAGFNAAVAGCFFALESVLRSSVSSSPASLTTAMVLLSSVLAAVVSQQILGSDPAVRIPLYEFRSPAELPLYLLLGLCCGGVSIALNRSARLATHAFDRLLLVSPLPPALLPAIGGLSVGVISLAYPEVLYWGFQNINDLLGSRPLASAPQVDFLVELVVLKVVATAICRGSGLVGGFYAPSLFIGAALGQAYGRLASDVLLAVDPEYSLQWIQVAAPQAYAMVGMAATLAGVCQVPLTSVLLLFELTRDYRIILPLMAAVGIAAWIAAPTTTTPTATATAAATTTAASASAASTDLPTPTTASQQQPPRPASKSSPSPSSSSSISASAAADSDDSPPASPQAPLPTPLPLAISTPGDFIDDIASLDIRDGVLLEEQVQREMTVAAAMRPASSPSVAAVPLMAVRPRVPVRSQPRLVPQKQQPGSDSGSAEADSSAPAPATPASPAAAAAAASVAAVSAPAEASASRWAAATEVVSRPSTVGQAVAAMVASRQWCCVVVGEGGCLEGLVTLVDVQQEVERRVVAERRRGGRGGRGGRRRAGGESAGESDGSDSGAQGGGGVDGGVRGDGISGAAGRVSEGDVAVKGAVEALPVSVLCTPWTQLETISPAASLYEARRRLTARGIRQLPVGGEGEEEGGGGGGERKWSAAGGAAGSG
ncbi:hypothetical protein CLOM_g14867 [Closterium sp. NIES-68]|nr:hypothetical protein CLOM_g14867 [Closterium sp. NIES-68]GJP62017.1 hypothetical protein CLOP_g19122 [Closterium sp. NIES-67]